MWYRQELLDEKLVIRIGKSTPNFDFNSVNRLFTMNIKRISPVASGVIYGNIFTQGSLSAFMPSYDNSAFGASAFYFPIKSFFGSFYLEPVISYIPQPGAVKSLPQTWAGTIRTLAYF